MAVTWISNCVHIHIQNVWFDIAFKLELTIVLLETILAGNV